MARVLSVLEHCESSSLAPFNDLSKRVIQRSDEAASNFKFLGLIQEPCALLANAGPQEVVALLTDLLNRIRVIWSISK